MAGAPDKAETSSRLSYTSRPQHTQFSEIMERSTRILVDETVSVGACKAFIQDLVKVVIAMEDQRSNVETKLLDIVKHIAKPEIYTTGTAVPTAEVVVPTVPGSPHKRPPLSPRTMMIEVGKDQRIN